MSSIKSIKSTLLSKIAGIEHDFNAEQAWPHRQVHGTTCHYLPNQETPALEGDGFWTDQSLITVGVRTADCVPILLAKKDGSAVAALHAGWRGTFDKIPEGFFKTLPKKHAQASEWVAAVGPAISPLAYPVSEELIRQFIDRFSGLASSKNWVRGNRHLDLQYLVHAQLLALGVSEVETLRICTSLTLDSSKNPFLSSFRRSKSNERQFSSIKILAQF